MGVRSVIIQDALQRPDVIEEIAHLEAAQEEEGQVSACLLTFLSSGVRRERDYAGIPIDSVMGQLVIITFPMAAGPRSYVFESILRVPGKKAGTEQLLNNHVPITREFRIDVGGQQHSLNAAYFCQQNGVTSICAHSAVRTLIRTLTQSPVTVPMLNRLWDYCPLKKLATTDQVMGALRHFGMAPVVYDLTKSTFGSDDSDVGWDLPALLADSATPSLLVLGGKKGSDHIVPILGHTMNSDEWHPIGTTLHRRGADTVSSSSLWTDHLIIHDDMLGSYYCLSKAGLMHSRGSDLAPKLVIAILPLNVHVSPSQAEDFARQILGRLMEDLTRERLCRGRWWKHIVEKRERRVFRTTLITRDDYLATLPSDADLEWIRQYVADALPERMWMAEISVPNIFLGNRGKLGEILINAESFPDDDPKNILGAMIAFRLPSVIGWADKQDGGVYAVTQWPELGHRTIHAPKHHQNWW